MIFFWIILYGATYITADKLSQVLRLPDWLPALAMLLYVGTLLLWLVRTGRSHVLGLCPCVNLTLKDTLVLLPLLAFPIYNLLSAGGFNCSFSAALLMGSVSLAEEIFFRGALLRVFSRRGSLFGVLLTSVLFGLFHIVNLIDGADLRYTLMQMLCGFAAGLSYGAVTVKYRNILPCAAAHFLTNITGLGVTPTVASEGVPWGLWLCIAINACHGAWLCRQIRCDSLKNKEIHL